MLHFQGGIDHLCFIVGEVFVAKLVVDGLPDQLVIDGQIHINNIQTGDGAAVGLQV